MSKKKKLSSGNNNNNTLSVVAKENAINGKTNGIKESTGQPAKASNKIQNDQKQVIVLKVIIPTLLALVIYVTYRDFIWSKERLSVNRPDQLLYYSAFKVQFPRLREPSLIEDSHRHFLFIMDLIEVGKHNIDYVSADSKLTYLAGQTPFKSDRTIEEQRDILGQLEEFNLTQIMININQSQNNNGFDSPVSLGSGSNKESKKKKSTLKTGNKVSQWFTRTIHGDAHFEIPNYPLDAQPNPDSITHIDVDLRDCSPNIHDQGHCGACYAFSWNSFAEWHYCKQSKLQTLVDFSEQHLVDCGQLATSGLSGCREGYLTDAKEFTQKFGFHLESTYPYKGKQDSCKQAQGTIKTKVVDFTRIQVIREEWEQVLKEQPIVLQVHLPKDIMSYQQGVHPGTNCDKNMAHGMLLVGYGREQGIPYWLLKNSMGSNWGENGYLRLSRDAPISQCFRTGFIAKFKFESLDDDAYYDFYDNHINFEPTVHVVENKPVISKSALDWFNGSQKKN